MSVVWEQLPNFEPMKMMAKSHKSTSLERIIRCWLCHFPRTPGMLEANTLILSDMKSEGAGLPFSLRSSGAAAAQPARPGGGQGLRAFLCSTASESQISSSFAWELFLRSQTQDAEISAFHGFPESCLTTPLPPSVSNRLPSRRDILHAQGWGAVMEILGNRFLCSL